MAVTFGEDGTVEVDEREQGELVKFCQLFLKNIQVQQGLPYSEGPMSSNGYPFVSRRQIIERIAAETAFALECVGLIEARKGWMASHRCRASKLLARLAAADPTPDDLVTAARLAARYSRTLARLFRERELTERPELAGQAAVFGVLRAPEPARSDATPSPIGTSLAATPGGAAETVSPAVAPKKRGRPKGSKNKPRSESAPRRRRRA